MAIRIQERPVGLLGNLYDRVSSYSNDPIPEMERLAIEASDDLRFNDEIEIVLNYRVPFRGYRRETRDQVGDRLGGVSNNVVCRIERDAKFLLVDYFPEEVRKKMRAEESRESQDLVRIMLS